MKPQTFESCSSQLHEQLAGIFESCPPDELFSSEAPRHTNHQHSLNPIEDIPTTNFTSFDTQQQDPAMNTETPVYNYSSNSDPATKTALTQRLYPANDDTQEFATQQHSFLDDDLSNYKSTDTSSFSAELKEALNYTTGLDQTIQHYHSYQSSQLSNYLEHWLKRPVLNDHFLQIFHGWTSTQEVPNNQFSLSAATTHLENLTPVASGGFYLRWNNLGIVINPGKKFMRRFHQAGLHIKDIDIVLVTNEDPESYTDIQEIYELNYSLNRASGDQQIIHYYLNQKAYSELATVLKPRSKSERTAIHCLELFPESPEIEEIELGDGILLNYFSTKPQFSLNYTGHRFPQSGPSHLGIRLELTNSQAHGPSYISLGYTSGGWSPFVGQHLSTCDILLAGIGNTHTSDYNKIVHSDDCLGYYGVCSLLEEISPKLIICTEFGSKEGDLRLELIKKMRSEYTDKSTVILPGDIGMCVDLKSLNIKCSQSEDYIDPRMIKVIRSSNMFGEIRYLSPTNYL